MKRILISFLTFILISNMVSAQSNFYKLSIGAGYGVTQSFTDVKEHGISFAGYGTADYFLTPFISLGAEFQMGQIRGGDQYTDPYREFVNSYKAANLNGKLYLGAIVDFQRSGFANAVKWLYAGAGLGLIKNDIDRIRIQPGTGHVFPGKNNATDLIFPMSAGINYYFPDRSGKPRFGLNLNYQFNLSIGEGIDGYDDSPIKFENGHPDVYTYISFGFKYNFGQLGLSNKSLY